MSNRSLTACSLAPAYFHHWRSNARISRSRRLRPPSSVLSADSAGTGLTTVASISLLELVRLTESHRCDSPPLQHVVPTAPGRHTATSATVSGGFHGRAPSGGGATNTPRTVTLRTQSAHSMPAGPGSTRRQCSTGSTRLASVPLAWWRAVHHAVDNAGHGLDRPQEVAQHVRCIKLGTAHIGLDLLLHVVKPADRSRPV
jgi:hypothetical protein